MWHIFKKSKNLTLRKNIESDVEKYNKNILWGQGLVILKISIVLRYLSVSFFP